MIVIVMYGLIKCFLCNNVDFESDSYLGLVILLIWMLYKDCLDNLD